ncbi:hypothetical protein [Yersinia artesiana]|uniref:hypothetical protein n=1 Tax=Yersinia artesiana TaxID=2890315 RepID=UPI001D125198
MNKKPTIYMRAENELLDNQLNPKELLRIDAATPVVLHTIAPLMAEFPAGSATWGFGTDTTRAHFASRNAD